MEKTVALKLNHVQKIRWISTMGNIQLDSLILANFHYFVAALPVVFIIYVSNKLVLIINGNHRCLKNS